VDDFELGGAGGRTERSPTRVFSFVGLCGSFCPTASAAVRRSARSEGEVYDDAADVLGGDDDRLGAASEDRRLEWDADADEGEEGVGMPSVVSASRPASTTSSSSDSRSATCDR